MNFEADTLSVVSAGVEEYGGKVSALLNMGEDLRSLPFASIEKKMFGGKGELFLGDRYLSFKSNGGFTKLKKKESVNYAEVTELSANNASNSLDWKFIGGGGSFSVGLVYYGRVKGINPRDIFWYDIDGFPERSGAFYSLVSAILPNTGLTGDLKPAVIRRTLQDALEYFQGSRSIEDSGMKDIVGNSLHPRYSAMVEAFTMFLAGTAASSDATADGYLDIFSDLDRIFASMLGTLRESLAAFKPGLLTGDRQVYDMGERFERLSSVWYIRQIAALHFASDRLDDDDIRHWSMLVLKPRARETTRNNRRMVSIELPEPEIFDKAISELTN